MPQDNPRGKSSRNNAPRGGNGRADRPRNEKPSSATGNPFADVGSSNVAARLRLQKEMIGVLSDISQDWFARATAEADLALRLPNRLTAARSVPDAITAYQEWFGEWVARCSEDSRRLFSDSEKIVDTGARCFTGKQTASTG
jgi:hypothetical protein